jgi:hypothetical protein
MTEQYLQTKLMDWLKGHGFYCVKLITCGGAGHPDIICCIYGAFFAFEIKSSRGKQSALQLYKQELIEVNEGQYYVVTPQNYGEIIEKLQIYTENNQ